MKHDGISLIHIHMNEWIWMSHTPFIWMSHIPQWVIDHKWKDSSICVFMCVMTHLFICHMFHIWMSHIPQWVMDHKWKRNETGERITKHCVSWLIYLCVSRLISMCVYVCHDSFLCVFIIVRHDSFITHNKSMHNTYEWVSTSHVPPINESWRTMINTHRNESRHT